MAIPQNIKLEHCLKAIEDIDLNGIEPIQKADYYYLYFGENRYPPKVVLRRANKYANGEELWSHHGGEYTNNFLIKRGFSIGEINQNEYPFFTKEEINNLLELYKTSSTEKSELYSLYGRYFKNTIFHKTNYWANNIKLEGFTIKPDWRWNRTRGMISAYSWARIFRNGDENKMVFFTVGVDARLGSIIYKLDCKNSGDKKLSEGEIETFNKYVYEVKGLDWQYVYDYELKNYNWSKLINETKKFIKDNLPIYDDVIKILNEEGFPSTEKNKLIKKPPKKSSKKFIGRDIDFEELNRKRKKYGNIGEDLTIKYEKKQLKLKGRNDLSSKVHKVKDGLGYDIIIF